MFLEELTPLFQELTKQPVAFIGGFFSGILNLNTSEDPLKTWLEQQSSTLNANNDDFPNGGPQSISID